jgi:hypothetical protein
MNYSIRYALALSFASLLSTHCAPPALDEGHGLKWKTQFPAGGHGVFSDGAAVSAGSYFLVGRAGTTGNLQRAALFELSGDGRINLRDPPGSEPDRQYTHIFQTGSGGFLIVSESSNSPRQGQIRLTEIDSTGTYRRESQSEPIAHPALRSARMTESGVVAVLTAAEQSPGLPPVSYIDEWDSRTLTNRPNRISIEHPDSVVFHDFANEGAEYLLLGEQNSRADELPEVKVFRIGRDGEIRATHTIGRGIGGRIVKDGAAGYWIVGWTTRAAIWRVAKSGRVASEKTYDCDGFSAAKATPDGLFVAGVLARNELTTDVCLYQIDANHSTTWSRTLASSPRNQRTYIHWLLPEPTQGLLLGGGQSEIENAYFEGFVFAAELK